MQHPPLSGKRGVRGARAEPHLRSCHFSSPLLPEFPRNPEKLGAFGPADPPADREAESRGGRADNKSLPWEMAKAPRWMWIRVLAVGAPRQPLPRRRPRWKP